MELVNKSICSTCGGKCCKQTGCYYSAEDLKVVSSRSIKNLLDKGYTCISSDVFVMKEDPIILSLRSRNKSANKIDLISLSRYCSALTPTGCMYDFADRPSGGKYLIPDENGNCDYHKVRLIDIIESWSPYQELLRSVCEEVSGIPFDELMRIQVEEYFTYVYEHQLYDRSELSSYQIVFPYESNKALTKVLETKDGDSIAARILKMF